MATMKKPKPHMITIGSLQVNRNHIALVAITLVLLYFVFMRGDSGVAPARASTVGLKIKHPALPDYVRGNGDLKHILTKVREMQVDVADFWLTHGPDVKWGGFYGTLDRQGRPTSPSYKGLIQQVWLDVGGCCWRVWLLQSVDIAESCVELSVSCNLQRRL